MDNIIIRNPTLLEKTTPFRSRSLVPPRSRATAGTNGAGNPDEANPERHNREPRAPVASPYMVHIIDDEEGIRRALTFMLRKAGFGVTSWANGKAFLDQLRRLSDGCVLLDIRMQEMDGLEVQEAMLAAGCTLPVIILTGHGDVSTAVAAMKAGAVDFLEKPFECDDLLQAIERAFARIEQAGQIETQTADASLKIAGLTSREQEILNGLALGLPNKTIAYDLGISARTVEVHRANLMMKLRVRSFPEALRIAFAAGLGA
jgi:two-component system response regulator FixJ